MTENRDMTRPYYWASEIPGLIGPGTPSLSSFYRYVGNGKIHKVDSQGQPDTAYDGEDVRRFLSGDLSRKKGSSKRERQSIKPERAQVSAPAPVVVREPIVDYVRERSDLAHIFLMESELLGESSLLPNTQLSWVRKNEYSYWFLSNPDAKDDVWATMAVLPLSEEKIFELLQGKIGLQDVSADDLLAYEPNHSPYSCYMSVITRKERQEALLQLLQRVFILWCEKAPNLQIGKLYVSVTKGIEAAPLRRLVKEFYFSPLYQYSTPSQMAWELDFNFYNPSVEIQKLQNCLKEGKKENMIAILPELKLGDEQVRDPLARKREARLNNKAGFERSASAASGFLTKDVQFRRVESDDDIRAVLDINASRFGKSTRPEEDLIRTRRSWIDRNPEIYHVLEISSEKLVRDGIYSSEELAGVDRKIVAFLAMLPLSSENVDRLVKGELQVSQVTGEDILPYVPGVPADLFVQTIAVHKTIESRSVPVFREYGRLLLKGVMGMFHSYGINGIELRAIYARSDTSYGIHTAQGVGFEQIPPPPGVHKEVFLLDIAQSERPFLVDYVAALQRYKQEHGLVSAS